MPRILNSFSPMTELGDSLQNLTAALFSGPGPRAQEQAAALAEQRRLHGDLYRAQAGKAQAEAAGLEQTNAVLADFIPQFVTANAGITRPQYDAFEGYRRTGAYPEGSAALDPATESKVRNAIAAATTYRADERSRNPDQLGMLLLHLQDAGLLEGARSGSVDRSAIEKYGAARAATGGKPAYKDLSGNIVGAINQYFGDTSVPDIPYNKALIGTETAKQGELGARARLSDAKAAKARAAPAAGTGKGKWILAPDPESDTGFSMQFYAADEKADVKGPKKKPLSSADLAKAIATIAGTSTDKTTGQPAPGSKPPLVGSDMADLMALSQQLYGAPDSAIPEGDVMGSVLAAVRKLGGGDGTTLPFEAGKEVTSPGLIFDTKRDVQRIRRAPRPVNVPMGASSSASAPPPSAPAQGAVPAASQRREGMVYQTPKGPMKWGRDDAGVLGWVAP